MTLCALVLRECLKLEIAHPVLWPEVASTGSSVFQITTPVTFFVVTLIANRVLGKKFPEMLSTYMPDGNNDTHSYLLDGSIGENNHIMSIVCLECLERKVRFMQKGAIVPNQQGRQRLYFTRVVIA